MSGRQCDLFTGTRLNRSRTELQVEREEAGGWMSTTLN